MVIAYGRLKPLNNQSYKFELQYLNLNSNRTHKKKYLRLKICQKEIFLVDQTANVGDQNDLVGGGLLTLAEKRLNEIEFCSKNKLVICIFFA